MLREFLEATYRDLEGNVALFLATGKTPPTEKSPNGKLIVNSPHWFAYPTELDLMVQFAEVNSDRDLYLTPATYGDMPYVDKKRGVAIPFARSGRPLFSREKGNARMCYTIYMDSDSCPPEAFRLPPSRHVQTSEGHGHDWWMLAEPIPASQAAEIAHRITTAHKEDGCDPSGWAENKVLRMPTVNTGYDELDPWEITVQETGEIYLADDISAAYDDIVVSQVVAGTGPALPAPKIEGLPEFQALADRIPASERRLNDLLLKEPKLGEKGWRSQQRWALELDLIRFGFNAVETATLVWHSPAGRKFVEDARGFDGLWEEITQRAEPTVIAERTPSSTPEASKPPTSAPTLLTDAQRRIFDNRLDFGRLYMEYAKSRLKNLNLPYHEINHWSVLALAFGEVAAIPAGAGELPFCIFSMTLGGSSSGKGDAFKIQNEFVNAIYRDSPDIGIEHSKSALLEQLLERDGKVSWLHGDEFQEKLAEIKRGGWTTGITGVWSEIYDGRVPSLGRVGKKDLNKSNVTTTAVMNSMGTVKGLLNVMDKTMFYSGWLARQVWVIGEDIEVTKDSLRVPRKGGTAASMYRAIPRYWAAKFAEIRSEFRANIPIGDKRILMDMTDEAADLIDESRIKIWKHFEEHGTDEDLWKTAIRRMFDIIWKIAGLEAIQDGRMFMATKDVIVALGYAEGWLENFIFVAAGIAETFFSTQADDIEKFIQQQTDATSDPAAIYRFRKGEETRVTDTYLNSLLKQGRIQEVTAEGGGIKGYRITKRREAKK